MIIFEIVSSLSGMASRISVERDWVIVISENLKKSSKDSSHELSCEINFQIYLTV